MRRAFYYLCRGHRAWLTAGLLLFAGCAVDQAKEVETYRRVVDLPAAATASHPSQPLSLRDALLLANQNNEDLSLEGERFLRALVNRRRAAANFLPTVDLVPSYSRREAVPSGDSGSSSGNGTLDVPVELDYTLFEGFANLNRRQRDAALARQRRGLLLDAQEALLVDVARVYYQVLRSEATVEVLESSSRVQEERLRETQGRLDAGMARPLDLAQTRAQLAQTRTTLVAARNDVLNARSLLAYLTAAPIEARPLADAFEPPANVPSQEQLIAIASAQRRDVLATEDAVKAARFDVEVAMAQYYPTVSLNLTAFLYRESLPDERDWTALLEANVPLFSAGRIRADVREAWSFFREAQLLRSQIARRATLEVRTAYHDLAAAEARLVDLRVQLDAAEQALEQADRSYQVGLATNLERIQAQDAALEAQLEESSARFDRKVVYLDLARATGMMREQLESAAPPAGGS